MSEEMTKEDLLNMKLPVQKKLDGDLFVRRVFGGWIYTEYVWNIPEDHCEGVSQCFVPEEINVYAKVNILS